MNEAYVMADMNDALTAAADGGAAGTTARSEY
jgi:hypothetical protein